MIFAKVEKSPLHDLPKQRFERSLYLSSEQEGFDRKSRKALEIKGFQRCKDTDMSVHALSERRHAKGFGPMQVSLFEERAKRHDRYGHDRGWR